MLKNIPDRFDKIEMKNWPTRPYCDYKGCNERSVSSLYLELGVCSKFLESCSNKDHQDYMLKARDNGIVDIFNDLYDLAWNNHKKSTGAMQ